MALELHDFDLYFNGEVITFPEGDSILRRKQINYSTKEPDIYHTVQQGDTLTYIAWKYYKDYTSNAPKYYKYIADVNKIFNPLDITGYIGSDIVIPNFNLIKLSE